MGNPASSASKFQFVVAASGLNSVTAGSLISSVGFRFAGSPFTAPVGAAGFSRYDIQIGRAANPTTGLITIYAANMGADTILARTEPLTIPANTFVDLPGEGPNAVYDLNFGTPYTDVGGDQTITIRSVPTVGNPGIALDAFAPDARTNTVFSSGSATRGRSRHVGFANDTGQMFTGMRTRTRTSSGVRQVGLA